MFNIFCSIPASKPKDYFMARNKLTGLVLGVCGWGRNPGCQVIQWPAKKPEEYNTNQVWYQEEDGTIRSLFSKMCIQASRKLDI